jgi:hypothetical protein
MQSELAQKSRAFQKQLHERIAEVSRLEAKVEELSSGLIGAQNEVKTLQAKLAASRNAAANVESIHSKGPGGAAKNGGAGRTILVGSAEAAEAAQVAQLKEDLYTDLTGLIIRDVKKRQSDHLYDCIQTGLNGSKQPPAYLPFFFGFPSPPCFLLLSFSNWHIYSALHFKLSVAQDTDSRRAASLESTEFHYMPLLDTNRDRQLMDILPDYLAVDITFSRQHASKFYNRVVDTLTKRRIDD